MELGVVHLAEIGEVIDAVAATAAGTTDVTGNAIDMKDATACMFVVGFGAITASAVTSWKIQESDDNSTYTDVTSASITIADNDDDQLSIIDVRRPSFTKRYLRALVDRGTANAVVDFGVAIKYGNNAVSVTQGTNASTTITETVTL